MINQQRAQLIFASVETLMESVSRTDDIRLISAVIHLRRAARAVLDEFKVDSVDQQNSLSGRMKELEQAAQSETGRANRAEAVRDAWKDAWKDMAERFENRRKLVSEKVC